MSRPTARTDYRGSNVLLAVTGPGPDLEHAVGRAQREQLGHARDDQRLRDRLPAADRQRAVLVRGVQLVRADEQLARYRRDRREHALVGDLRRRGSAHSRAQPPAREPQGVPAHGIRPPDSDERPAAATRRVQACSRRRGERPPPSPGKECITPHDPYLPHSARSSSRSSRSRRCPALAGKPANPGKSKTAPHGKHKGFGKGVTKLKSGTTTLDVDAGTLAALTGAGFGVTPAVPATADRLDVLVPDHQGPRAPGQGQEEEDLGLHQPQRRHHVHEGRRLRDCE